MNVTQEQLQQVLILSDHGTTSDGRSVLTLGFLPAESLPGLLGAAAIAFSPKDLDTLRVGDLLVENESHFPVNTLTETLVQNSPKDPRKAGAGVTALGQVWEESLFRFLTMRFELLVVDLKTFHLNPETVRLIPEEVSRRFNVIVLMDTPWGVLVGMSDPTDLYASDEITDLLRRPVVLSVVNHDDLQRGLNQHYRNEAALQNFAEELAEEVAKSGEDESADGALGISSDAPVVKIIQSLFDDAVRMGASDIHIEPDQHVLRIRQRIDGSLVERILNMKRIAPALISKIKLMGGMEISERRLAQDGRFHITVRDKHMDVRVSTMPTQGGESVVMRLLDQSHNNLSLEAIGLPPEYLERIRRLLSHPHGMILVTGPTGSGKTTTLYGALNELNTPDRKLITVEDPVEYRLPRVNQVQVMSKIGWNFATVLRTALRQDPDVILVGEMRDRETAEIAVRAALTGHLVLSTLHTNDAARTPVRMIDMGIEGYAVADSLLAILSQRLVRRVCPDCASPHQLTEKERDWLARLPEIPNMGEGLIEGKGCAKCNESGFRGRLAVIELLEMNTELSNHLRAGDTRGFLAATQQQSDFEPLHVVAARYAHAGRTALAEAIRLCPAPEQAPRSASKTYASPPPTPANPTASTTPGAT
ncbi:MAG: type II/IV secretion system protein [Magnetococcales bacterium]|nr:type II/IV secretion system protein [Magnetococcales bacterium]